LIQDSDEAGKTKRSWSRNAGDHFRRLGHAQRPLPSLLLIPYRKLQTSDAISSVASFKAK